jgi:hypothetical protein
MTCSFIFIFHQKISYALAYFWWDGLHVLCRNLCNLQKLGVDTILKQEEEE